MDLFEAFEKRHSIRKFLDKEVEEEKLQRILEACNRAPSAGNLQAYRILIVKDSGKRDALSEMAGGQGAISQAPIVLIFCANPRESGKYGERGESLYSIQDATIATTHCLLAATALGLGTVWIGSFDEEKVKEILGLKELKPVAIIPVGYPGEEPKITGRKNLEELAREV